MILRIFWAQSSLWLVSIYTLLRSNSLCWQSSLTLHILLLLPFIYLLELTFPSPRKSNTLNCTTLYHPLPGKRLLTFTLLLLSKFPCEGKRDPYQNNLIARWALPMGPVGECLRIALGGWRSRGYCCWGVVQERLPPLCEFSYLCGIGYIDSGC